MRISDWSSDVCSSDLSIDELDSLKADSLDFYARIRSLYRQYRENEINNGVLPGESPTFSEAPGTNTSSLESRYAEPPPANSPRPLLPSFRRLAAAGRRRRPPPTGSRLPARTAGAG